METNDKSVKRWVFALMVVSIGVMIAGQMCHHNLMVKLDEVVKLG